MKRNALILWLLLAATCWGQFSQSRTGNPFVQSGTGAVPRDLQAKLRERKSVLDFIPVSLHAAIAAKTDTTDLTTYLQAANDACEAAGAELFWPAGLYTFSTLTQDKPVRWVGAGWSSITNVAFAHADWTDNSECTGTILRSTATSGTALAFTDAENYPYRLERFILIGPGSGTSTGIKIGTAADGAAQGRVVDIQVANFSVGWEINGLNEYRFDGCRSRGCSTGFKLQNAVNECTFTGTEVQHSTVKGIVCNNVSGCSFNGMIIQNISGDVGLEITRGCDNLTFIGGWAEASTATWVAQVGTSGAGAASAAFIGWRTSVTNGFQIDQAKGVAFINCRFTTGGVTITANATDTCRFGSNIPDWNDSGISTTAIPVDERLVIERSDGPHSVIGAPTWDETYVSLQTLSLAQSAANSAINQSPAGGTIVNSASGQDLLLRTGNGTRLTLNTTAITTTEPILFSPDNSNDIGAFGATRPRDVHVADDIIAGGEIQGLQTVTADTDGGSYTAEMVADQVYCNTGDADGQTINLPAAAAGMRVTFYCTVAQNIVINPDNADQILGLTNAVGDSITGNTVGASVRLVAIDATNWAATSTVGTWTDTN